MQTTQQSTDAAIAEAHSEKVRAIYAAAAPWRETAERGELLSFDSVQQIKDMNAATGGHFFDADSMRYFGSKVYGPVIGGRYFITSEQDRNPYGAAAWNGQRRYTVRECRNGDIETISDFGEFATLAQARTAARKVAAND